MITPENMLQYMDRVTPQWIAGLFDGEGCVSSSLDSYGNVKLRVEIAQSNIHVLQLICTKVPGTIFSAKQKNKSGTVSDVHRIRWNDGGCLKILEYIKDYVIIKHTLVETGIKLSQLFMYSLHNKGIAADIVRQERSLCRDKIVEINAANRAKSA